MSSKHSAGSARGFGRPRECATTARQKGLPSAAKRASEEGDGEEGEEEDDGEEGEGEGEEDGDDDKGADEEEEEASEEREGQGALYALRNPWRTRGSGGGSRPWSAA